MPSIGVQTHRRTQVVEITNQVGRDPRREPRRCRQRVRSYKSAGIVIQERDDPDVAIDLEMALERIVDETWPLKHIEEGNVNPWPHVRTALTASSVVIPLVSRRLALGTYQGVFLCKLDGPKHQMIIVTMRE